MDELEDELKEDLREQRNPIHLPDRRRYPSNIELELIVLRQDIQELRDDVKDLVEAWQAASFAIKAIKTIASVALAISSLVFLITSGINNVKT